jgi:hypothetical protein
MADIWVVLTVLGFFGLCVVLVWGCDRIIGADEQSELAIEDEPPVPEPELREVA